MVFSGSDFLFVFLPAFLLASTLLPARNLVLLAFSLAFYFIGEGWFVLLMLFSCSFNYVVGLKIDEASSHDRKRIWLVAGLIVNLAILAWFKYVVFFLSSLLGEQTVSQLIGQVYLPLGISFFTFQAISYLVDVYREETRAERSLHNVALYISMFPQLVAGPIVRFASVAEQITNRQVSLAHCYNGIILFIFGLSQKVLIADPIGGVADTLFADPQNLGVSAAWLAAGAYTIQIFFDFAGYSNMAIGLGLLMGFNFPQNFNFPYASKSITEFWRRWHMSLSSWFRDYLYIPLGGNRLGAWKTYRNLVLVFLLCGLWHGAAWTFVFWGAYHGFFLVLERIGWGSKLSKLPGIIALAYTLLVVVLGWVFFRAESFGDATTIIMAMFGAPDQSDPVLTASQFLSSETLIRIVAALLLSTAFLKNIVIQVLPLPEYEFSSDSNFRVAHAVVVAIAVGLAILCALHILGGAYSPFLYFRF